MAAAPLIYTLHRSSASSSRMRRAWKPWRALCSGSLAPGTSLNLREAPFRVRPLSTAPLQSLYTTNSLSVQSRNISADSQSQSLAADPTIYALSTAPGRAAIAVIRISGPACSTVYHALCPSRNLPKPRYAAVRTLYEPDQAPSPENVLDSNALVLYFPAPRTVTGEDVLELHVHGGQATVKAVLSAIPKCSKIGEGGGVIRYAEPGEFTKRAFMNDRLDLTQVEALGDVLSATTEQQRRLYVRGTTNQLSRRYEAWRSQLLYARGELEALIDFSEDQHFDESPALLTASVAEQVRRLRTLVQAHSKNAVRGELLRNGISISLLGAPNAGKSSLLNRIVGREAAIVSQEAGTTRDIVEVGIDLGGYFCRLGDTAGLRRIAQAGLNTLPGETVNEGGETEIKQGIISKIEQEGMRRAKERATESDVVIAVLSFERQSHDPDTTFLAVDSEVAGTAAALTAEKRNVLVVVNKTDLVPSKTTTSSALQTIETAIPGLAASQIHFVSCREAELSKSPDHVDPGRIQAFLTGLVSKFHEMTSPLGTSDPSAGEADPSFWQESLGASERHRLLLEECQEHLTAFLAEVEGEYAEEVGEEHYGNDEVDVVLAAESLRAAGNCLARITGKGEAGDVEEVLGVVFEKFCVGK